MREMRSAYRVFVGKPEGKKPLGRPKCRWEDNNKVDPQEVEWRAVDRIDLDPDGER